MRKVLKYIALFLILLPLTACRKDQPLPRRSAIIRFAPNQVSPGTKAIIKDDADLRTACTGLTNQAIAVWADKKSSSGVVTTDVFNGVYLRWQEVTGPEGHEDNPKGDETSAPSYWNTFDADGNSGPVGWNVGETYIFRAYYPAGVELKENTNANLFIAEYQSDRIQEDLMVAYTKITTDASNIESHVPLNLKHMLAAFSFSFSFKEGDAIDGGFAGQDRLTSMWLENTSTGSFYDYGMLSFGDGSDGSSPGDEPQKITWHDIFAPAEGVHMYEWVAPSGGILLKNEETTADHFVSVNKAIAYQPNGSLAGNLYTHNPVGDRYYVFTIPQTLRPGTDICFKTVNGRDAVFRAALPTTLTVPSGMNANALEAGCRYDIDLVITKLSIDVLITIKPWNVLESSYVIQY